MVDSIPTIDHKALAISRLATEFRESTNLIAYIQAIMSESNDLEAVFQQLLNERNISNAVGVQLDILGEIVGQSRYIDEGFFPKFFGFKGQRNASGFNTVPFWDGIQDTISGGFLEDETYRQYIKAKAYSNSASSTTEDLISVFKLLFGNEISVLTRELGNANLEVVVILESLTPEEEQLIKNGKVNRVLPLAAGVNYDFYRISGNGSFGFAGNPIATGFNNGGFLSLIGN